MGIFIRNDNRDSGGVEGVGRQFGSEVYESLYDDDITVDDNEDGNLQCTQFVPANPSEQVLH